MKTLAAALPLILALASPALPQGVTTQPDTPPSPLVIADVLALVTAAVPTRCATIPAMDTLSGTMGSGGCFTPADASRPSITQGQDVTTDGAGAWSITWGRPFVSATPRVSVTAINPGSLPVVCNVATRSSTGASGRCWQATSTTLGGTLLSIAGLVVNPFGSAAPAFTVQVLARDAPP